MSNLSFGQITTEIPDLLWPQGSVIDLSIQNAQAGDAFAAFQVFAIEVYTEAYPGILVPSASPVVV